MCIVLHTHMHITILLLLTGGSGQRHDFLLVRDIVDVVWGVVVLGVCEGTCLHTSVGCRRGGEKDVRIGRGVYVLEEGWEGEGEKIMCMLG